MRTFLLVFLVLLSACADTDENVPAVIDMFKGYQSALLEDDGVTAVGFLSDKTVAYYSDAIVKANTMSEDELRQESFLDRFTVLRVRDTFDSEQLATMTGEQLLVYAIEQSWIDKEGTALFQIRRVTLNNDFAAIRMTRDGAEIPFPFEAYNEDGRWKLDLTSVFAPANVGFVQQAEASGLTQDQFMHQVLIALGSADGLTADLWLPAQTQRRTF